MWAVLFCVSTKGTELLLSVILNEAAGGVKDPGRQLHIVILNGVKYKGRRLAATDSSLPLRMTETE